MSQSRDPEDAPDDDTALFRREVGEVRPVKTDRLAPAQHKPAPAAPMRRRDEREALEAMDGPIDWLEVETGEELAFLRPGIQKRVLKNLRRGHYSVAARLDLHQMNLEAARSSIDSFLADALARGITCVKIIHGKGLRSKSGPVLKNLTNSLLRRRKAVLAFVSTPPHDGGTGAVYVLLKRR